MYSYKKITIAALFSLSCTLPVYAANPMKGLSDWTKEISQATDGRLNLSGYVNAHYMKHQGAPVFVGKNLNKALAQIREFSLFADVVLSDSLIFSTELELSYDITNLQNSGRERRFEALFNYYYVDFDLISALDLDEDEWGAWHVRGGRFLVPFLQYNENKPNFKQNLMSAPFTAWQLVPVNNTAVSFQQFGWTDVGLQLNTSQPVDSGIFNLKISLINGLGEDQPVLDSNAVTLNPPGMMKPTVRPRDGLGNAKSDWDELSDNNNDVAVAAKLSFGLFDLPLNIGVSWYQGAWDNAGDHELQLYGWHLDYLEQDWSVKGEWVEANVEQTAGINVVAKPGPAMLNKSTGDYSMSAWYLETSYTAYRYDVENFVKLVARFDRVETNDKAIFTPFNRSRITLGTEWQFMPNIRLRYERQITTLDDYDSAPMPYIMAGGEERVDMDMISIIAHF